jgi:hypothetical protein
MIGLPLWVKYQQRVYLYYIISSPSKRNSSFEILLEGKNCKIYLDAEELWVESTQSGPACFDVALIQLIGKAINSHFHIKKHHYN